MSRPFISRSQNQNIGSNHSNVQQKKIDPQAQLDWINNREIDYGFGVINNDLPAVQAASGNETAQMFAKDENRYEVGKNTGIQMKKDDVVWPAELDISAMGARDDQEGGRIKDTNDDGEEDNVKKQIIIDGQLFNYYKTVLMEANEIIIQISLEFAGEKLTNTAENTLARMRAAGYKSGSNGLLYKTKIVSRQKWINGQLKWIKEGKNIGNKNFTTKGLELTTTKTTLKKQLGIALKEFGGAAVDLADMMVCAEKGNVLDALPTAFLVDMEVERINEIINDVSEKLLSEKILEGSESVSNFLKGHYGLYKKYDLIEADSSTVNGILNQTINTYSQLLESIYNNSAEKTHSILYRKDSENLNIRAVIENKS